MRLFIEPTEPLLFRTARPFDAGENNLAESIFPPTPETLQGAIRAAIATQWDTTKTLQENFRDEKLTSLIGDRNSYGRFRISGITLGRRPKQSTAAGSVECLYPMPANILQEEGRPESQTRLVPKKRPDDIRTNLPDDKDLLYPEKHLHEKPETRKGWLTERGLWNAFQPGKKLDMDDIVSANTIYTSEPRLGIGMHNKTKTTREGFLYQVHMIRMNHIMDHPYTYGFVIDIRLAEQPFGTTTTYPEQLLDDDGTQKMLRMPDQGWLTLGGERRAARFEVIKPAEMRDHESLEFPKKGNLLYLATPAAFDRGWQPRSWANWAEPVAVAMERYQPIGGWLLTPGSAGGENKPQRRCVPAGSIYFFREAVSASIPFTDYGQAIGYGITFAGEW